MDKRNPEPQVPRATSCVVVVAVVVVIVFAIVSRWQPQKKQSNNASNAID